MIGSDAERLPALLRGHGDLSVHFQPVVDLTTGHTVALEALARGPAGSDLASPAALFGAARDADLLVELDWTCRALALSTAAGHVPPGCGLLVNVEPSAAAAAPPPHLAAALDAPGLPPVTAEITERALGDDPAALLGAVDDLRARGWRIALDDVGAEPASVTLLPVLQPDVVKLDLALVQALPDATAAATLQAVQAYAEQSGAAVVAEGIETAEQARYARALGARYGQGFWFARPSVLREALRRPVRPSRLSTGRRHTVPTADPAPGPAERTPFDVVARRTGARPADPGLLAVLADRLAAQAAQLEVPPVVLVTTRPGRTLPLARAGCLRALSLRSPLVGLLGTDLGPEPVPDSEVLSGSFPADDRLAREWAFVVVGAHLSAALVAQWDSPDGEPARAALTYDRALVGEAARPLLRRLEPRVADPVGARCAPGEDAGLAHLLEAHPLPPVDLLASASRSALAP